MRVVVMNNLFQNQSGLGMHRKYDLKGSTQARFAALSPPCLAGHAPAEQRSLRWCWRMPGEGSGFVIRSRLFRTWYSARQVCATRNGCLCMSLGCC
jgi:hypothetical protein